MPHNNRVDPFGNLHAVTQHGTLMGNRGNLHDANGTILRRFKRKAWVTCLLDFRGRKRTVMAPGSYTELFFLDEATAFSAGHRPCGTCRKDALAEFKLCWREAKGMKPGASVDLKTVDQTLHDERMAGAWSAALGTLPDGTMLHVNRDDAPCLWWRGYLLAWSFDGYRPTPNRETADGVSVITPISLVEVLRVGYPVSVHPSASP